MRTVNDSRKQRESTLSPFNVAHYQRLAKIVFAVNDAHIQFSLERCELMDRYTLRYVNGHYEIYLDREFVCSADTWTEAYNEISAMRR